MQTPTRSMRDPPATRNAWLWFIVGGVFILIPGVVVLFYYNVWDLFAAPYGLEWSLFSAVVLGPPGILVAIGIIAIVVGAHRYREARAA